MNEHELWARTREYHHRLDAARQLVDQALSQPVCWYVALSGGKDSTVVLDLARQCQPDIAAVWSDDEWYLPETEDYMGRMRESGINLHHIRTNARHAEWLTVVGDWDSIQHYAREHGWLGSFLGLRAEESRDRRVHLRAHGALYYCRQDQMWQCNPIAKWSTRDVWAYIHSRGIDYNRAYDRLAEIGVAPDHQRIGPLAVERVLGYGQLVILKRGWPDLFNRFAAAHPEAGSYT